MSLPIKIVPMKKKPAPTNIVIVGIICLTILEMFALYMGINGTMLTIVVAVIAAAIGVIIPTPKIMKGYKNNGMG